MDKLVGAVQDTLESGARAIDSAINDINAGTANPGRHPQRLARLVAPQLLVIQVYHLISKSKFYFSFSTYHFHNTITHLRSYENTTFVITPYNINAI